MKKKTPENNEQKPEIKKREYTAMELLEIKGAFTYFAALVCLGIIAHTFQFLAKVEFQDILAPLAINLAGITIAYFIYRAKKRLKKPRILPWLVGFITVNIGFLAKIKYVTNIIDHTGDISLAWTFGLQSYNTTVVIIIFMCLLYLLYNKKVYIFFSIYGVALWIIFIALAIHYKADVTLLAWKDGIPIVSGVVIYREIFFVIIVILLLYMNYRNIPVIRDFDERTTFQLHVIEEQSAASQMIARGIKESMDGLFTQVDEQNILITRFNDKMQSQSATFEEVSATLEELLSSAESIHDSSVDQIDGNVKMEEIVNEFKNIKLETKHNLGATYSDIESVVAQTTSTRESIQDVENTIDRMQDQSNKIGETVQLIIEIADKINLLSLNASIEAARAGEFGKGFAVVADEIGKLAVQTAESIKEVEKVLTENTQITNTGVTVINDTAEKIKELIDRMAESSQKIKVLQESILIEEKYINIIIDQMFKNIDLAKSIGTGTEEQKRAIQSSTEAIEHVTSIVSEMVKEVQELANTSQRIVDNATGLLQKSQ